MKEDTRCVCEQKNEMSWGLAAALCKTDMARMLAAGAGDSRASTRSSASANEKTSENETGPRSLSVRLTMTAGS